MAGAASRESPARARHRSAMAKSACIAARVSLQYHNPRTEAAVMTQTPLDAGGPVRPRDGAVVWFEPLPTIPAPGSPDDTTSSSGGLSAAVPWREIRWVGF